MRTCHSDGTNNVVLGLDGGAVHFVAGPHALHPVDVRICHWPSDRCGACPSASCGGAWPSRILHELRLDGLDRGHDADFRDVVGTHIRLAGKREHACVDFLEPCDQRVEIAGSADARGRRGYLDIFELTVIANVGDRLDLDRFLPEPLAHELFDEFVAQLVPDVHHRLHSGHALGAASSRGNYHGNGLVTTVRIVHAGTAPCGEAAGPWHGDPAWQGALLRKAAVQRPATACRAERNPQVRPTEAARGARASGCSAGRADSRHRRHPVRADLHLLLKSR